MARKFVLWVMTLVFSLGLISCAPTVKTDLLSLFENPKEYRGKRIIIATDLKSVVEDPAAYLDRRIELAGYVVYNGHRGFYSWNFFLKDTDGRTIRCYEREYRIRSWIVPVWALRRAERKNEQITAVGKLQTGLELELDWIEYQGQTIDTDYKPPQIGFPSSLFH